jgi:hypothetical protein
MENTGGLSMKRLTWIFIASWLLLTSLPCSAEWYKYRDKNGVWHYSDTLTTKAPLDHRKIAEKHKEPDDYLSVEEREKKRSDEARAREEADEARAAELKQQQIKDQYANLDEYNALEDKRVELDGIYKKMMEQKHQLDIQKDKVDSPEAYQQHRAAVSKYNESAAEYKLRREAYEQALKLYEQKNKARAGKEKKI